MEDGSRTHRDTGNVPSAEAEMVFRGLGRPPAGPELPPISLDGLFWGRLFIIDLKATRVPLYSSAQPERAERLQLVEERHLGG